MASVTCTRSDLFPNTTVIKAYPRQAFHQAGNQAPAGASISEATMTSGTCTLEGLTAGNEYTLAAEVAGVWTFLAVQAPASTAIEAATGAPEPALQQLLAFSYDPLIAIGTYQLGVAGTLYKARIPVKSQIKVSNILLGLTTKGATLTAGQCFAALYAEGTRKLLAKVSAAETIAKLTGTNGTLQTLPLESAIVLGPGYVDLGIFYNGTTAPTLAASSSSTLTYLANAGVSGAGTRFSTADTGATTEPPATMSSTQTAIPQALWAALT